MALIYSAPHTRTHMTLYTAHTHTHRLNIWSEACIMFATSKDAYTTLFQHLTTEGLTVGSHAFSQAHRFSILTRAVVGVV
jgi:hypothetical protein